MHMISIKISRLLPIDTIIVVMELGVDIKSKIIICKIVICNVLMNLLMYLITVLGYIKSKYGLACWVSLENHAIEDYIFGTIVSWDNQRINLCNV